ncbi:MAG: polysulfide reductase NrfD [Thermodesulfobacteria bacterium]|nr:polysulfide reductase NrfD [Thermodesulfobacteriota bacterium]
MALNISIDTLAEPTLAKTKINIALAVCLGIVGTALLTGVYAFIVGHQHVYGVTREVPWGILISTYAFFAITSTGLCLLAALGHSFGGNKLAALGNRAVFLSIVTILSAFLAIGLELENPHRMLLYNVISPNFSSNIWWMGTLYGLAVGCMFLEFFAILTRKWQIALAIGIAGALAEVGANTNLGAVFATLSARPFWYGAQLPVYFLCSAFMSGAAAIILFTHLSHRMRGAELDEKTYSGVQMAGKVLALTLFLLIVATVWRFISLYVGGNELARLAADNLLTGPLSMNFWVFETVIGLILPLFILIGTQMKNVPAMATASLMALVGAFVQRFDLVVAGQETPVFYGWDNLPKYINYVPSIGEMIIVAGAVALCVAGFIAGERLFGRIFSEAGHH